MKLTKLSNNLNFITAPMKGTKTVTVLVMVGTGAKYENKKNSGVSHFVEHMLFKGTKKRKNTLAISSELDGIGADFNAFTSKEYTGYYIKTSQDNIDIALDVVSDMYFNSKMSAVEIEREKGVIIEEFNMYLDNPMMHVDDVFEDLLYGDTPAGRDTIGTKKSIMGLKRPDFVSYFSNQYNSKNTIVCLAGNVKNQIECEKKVKKYFLNPVFKDRGKNFKEKEVVNEKQVSIGVKAEYKKTDQAHLILGVRSCSWSDKDKIISRLLAIILGGSMSSRLFVNLRGRNGLAYYVRTSAESYTDTGYLATGAGVPADKIDQAIKIIMAEYRKMKTSLVTPTELKRAKDLLKGKFAIQMEASDNLANWYARQAVIELTNLRLKDRKIKQSDLFSPDKYLKVVAEVTAADIKRVANKIFVEEGLNLAVIGPFKDEKELRKNLKF